MTLPRFTGTQLPSRTFQRIFLTLGVLVGQGCSMPPDRLAREETVQPSTPPWIRGMWTRDWIEARGERSSRSAVHYLQTPSLYADMRIPTQRPSFALARSFADLSDADLLVLARQQGFTGQMTAAADTFTWHHEIDFQPSDGSGDVGLAERLGESQWYERALDSSYVELWRSIAAADDTYLVVRVERADRLERTLLVAGDYFLYVRNRPRDLPQATSLDSLIRATNATREQIIEYLDCEFSTGRVRGGRIRWEVQASTIPWREGRELAFASTVTVRDDSAHLDVQTGGDERVLVPVNTLSTTALVALFPRTP